MIASGATSAVGRDDAGSRWVRPAIIGLSAVIVLAAVAIWQARFAAFEQFGAVAIDYRTFVDEGHRLLDHGSPYLAYQLAGPYEAQPDLFRQPADVPFLYPPPIAIVGVMLTVLPAVLWWIVPLSLLLALVVWWRPAPWTWPLIALAMAWPSTSAIVVAGGSTMWAAALVAAGLRFGWPAALLMLKPSLAPLVVVGIRRRSWWIAVAGLGISSLLMWPLWGEYLSAIRNASDVAPWYSIGDLPLLAVPIVAWLGREHARGGGHVGTPAQSSVSGRRALSLHRVTRFVALERTARIDASRRRFNPRRIRAAPR